MISVTRELAPVFCGLMVAGRIGAAMAAEIGTMRVTEQIDALVTLSTNPFKYLVAPRLLAGLIVLPLLVLIGDVILPTTSIRPSMNCSLLILLPVSPKEPYSVLSLL